MNCSLPGSSVHGILQARILEWLVSHSLLQGIFPTQGLNLGLLHCRWILYHLSHQESRNKQTNRQTASMIALAETHLSLILEWILLLEYPRL